MKNYEWIKYYISRCGWKTLIQYVFFQKILWVNVHVTWLVHWLSSVSFPKNITLIQPTTSPGFSIGCYIQAMNGFIIGKYTRIGLGVKIISANHNLYDFSKHECASPIKIGDYCWIGANAVILPGVELGTHTIVAAGAVVSKSFLGGNCILAGVPAKIIKEIGDYDYQAE